MRHFVILFALSLAACGTTRSGDEPTIVRQPKQQVAKAGFLPSTSSIPAERDGVRVEDTGAIMFVCSNSPKHEDKEVLIRPCPSCSEQNYFYWDYAGGCFRCFACTKVFDNAKVVCPECGRTPRRVRTKNTGK